MSTLTRISAACLVSRVKAHGRTRYWGLLNKKSLEAGKRMITAPGGALKLTEAGVTALRAFDVTFEKEPKPGDAYEARFTLPTEYAEQAIALLATRDPLLMEIDPAREFEEEFGTKELPLQDHPILASGDFAETTMTFLKTVKIDPIDGKGSSARASDVPTRRVFHLFEVAVSDRVYDLCASSLAIRISSDSVPLTPDFNVLHMSCLKRETG